MIEARVLPPEEWPRLTGTLLESVWPSLDPQLAHVLVCEDDGRIVGCVALLLAWHLDGVWSDPTSPHRVSIHRRLLRAVRELLRRWQIREVLMMATTEDSARLCRKLGPALHLTCDHFAVQMEQ